MNRSVAIAILAAAAAACPAAEEIPAPPQSRAIVIQGATVHPIGKASFVGSIVFDQGKITALGKKTRPPKDAKVIDGRGRHVYPGFIDCYSNIGLVEINAVRATRDYRESGEINPNVRAQVAVNPDSEIIPVTRSNGVLLAASVPQGGLIAGQSALLQLDGWTWEDLTLQAPLAMHLRWPTMTPVDAWWEKHSREEQVDTRDKELKQLDQVFADARAYQKSRDADKDYSLDARLEAMQPVLASELPIMVRANDLAQIRAAVAFASRQKVRIIIYGGWDAPRCAGLLKEHNVPVVVSAVYRLPRRRWEDYDSAYTLPARLKEAGVEFCIAGSGRFGASNLRNLPYHAAMAIGWGLSRDDAVRAITLDAAKILGVDDRVGSLEVGKDATLFIADGDPLETTTHVQEIFIQGREVQRSDKHQRLWKKYQQRYEQGKGSAETDK